MLDKLLGRTMRIGRLTLHLPDGRKMSFGESQPNNPRLDIAIRLRGTGTPLKIALDPELQFGEAYMNGDLTIERGTLADLFELLGRNLRDLPPRGGRMIGRMRNAWDFLRGRNSLRAAVANVHHHYDLSGNLYSQFLDSDMQYSCAYFERPDMSLEEAQVAKKQHIIAKLALRPGMKVLDIGCGWGGMGLSIARACPDVSVLGITLSREQHRYAETRAREEGLADRVQFALRDYRKVEGPFDRIVSVGMFEHVGRADFVTYFRTISALLTDDGAALIHSIGRKSTMSGRNPWIDKYIFPGGYIPTLSEAVTSVEKAGLWITDVEILRRHYAETLRAWGERFANRRSYVAELYDERFCRMWEFYLASCEMTFRYGDLMVIQAQLTKRIDALPFTRDYMMAATGADQPAKRKETAMFGPARETTLGRQNADA
jgi:cyclopropane-fatty-acyl-phospholipid synthase